MRSNQYVILFIASVTIVVGLVLSLMATVLRPIHDQNEAIFNKKAILAAIESELGENVKASKLSKEEVTTIFENNIDQQVVDIDGNIISKEEVENRGYKGGLAENVDMAKEKKKDLENRIFPVFIYSAGDGDNI